MEDWILIVPGFHWRTGSWLHLDFIGGLDPDYTRISSEDLILIIPGFHWRTGSWLYLNFIGGLDPDYTLISLEDWILIIPGFHRRTRSWLYLDFIGGLDPDPPTWHWYNPSSSSRTSEIFNDQSPASCNIFIYSLTSYSSNDFFINLLQSWPTFEIRWKIVNIAYSLTLFTHSRGENHNNKNSDLIILLQKSIFRKIIENINICSLYVMCKLKDKKKPSFIIFLYEYFSKSWIWFLYFSLAKFIKLLKSVDWLIFTGMESDVRFTKCLRGVVNL